MIDVIGVSFKNAGKIYYFQPGDLPVKRGLNVIVETARGVEFGTCVGEIKQIDEEEFTTPVKPILRIATKRDREQEEANREKEKKAFGICKEKIAARGLDMKLIGVEYTFDNSKVLFYFTADGRVDFRELVKDLAGVFRTRIELRQIGVRDETKIMGGIGICGRPLCCHVYLSGFAPVSIKMAKEQNLSLNPTKISGVCGRLMCCLKNEEDTYEYLNKLLPGVGDTVTAEGGLVEGEVHSVNVLRQTVKVLVQIDDDEREIREYKAEELVFEPGKGKKGRKDKKKRRDAGGEDVSGSVEESLSDVIDADEADLSELEKLEELEELEEAVLREESAADDRSAEEGNRRKDGPRRDNNRYRRDNGQDKKDRGRYRKDNDRKDSDRRDADRKDGDRKDGERKYPDSKKGDAGDRQGGNRKYRKDNRDYGKSKGRGRQQRGAEPPKDGRDEGKSE
ncbi:MAG: hypothetical protein J5842_01430 [Lachnospiraceae bacterium]|nr:hypothetical protein [Lachnospiraceae bacterium]